MGALILKENLSKAVNIGFNGELFEYAWGSEMFEISLKAFKLKEHEESVLIPVKLSVRIPFILVLKVQFYCFVSYKIF